MKEIGNKIKERRKQIGLTQIEVSDAAKVAKQSCRRIEAGLGCNVKTLLSICKVLRLQIEIY